MSQSVLPVSETDRVDASPTLTFEEYLVYEGEPDVLYELHKGKLIPMAAATALHASICEFLVYILQRYLAEHNLDLVAKTNVGVRTEDNSSRIPDVIVCTQSLWEQLLARPGAGVFDLDETPVLIVEVVSQNERQDYVTKRAEYENAGVLEYWMADPKPNRIRVRVATLPENETAYEQANFVPGQNIVSLQFPDLVLSVDQILSPPLVEDLIRQEQSRLQQADRLAARLREMGIDPDSI